MFHLGLANPLSKIRMLMGFLIRRGWRTRNDVEIISAIPPDSMRIDPDQNEVYLPKPSLLIFISA